MKNASRFLYGGVVLGFLIWFVPYYTSWQNEAWDAPLYYIAALLCAGFFTALPLGEHYLLVTSSVLLGQLIFTVFPHGVNALTYFSFLLLLFYSFFILLGAYVGVIVTRLLTGRWPGFDSEGRRIQKISEK